MQRSYEEQDESHDGLEQFPLLPEKLHDKGPDLWTQYKHFVDRGNVVNLAVGLVIGTAFAAVVSSFVSDILSPVLGLITTSRLSETFVVLRHGTQAPYKTRESARADGALTWNYGQFIQTYLNFIVITASLFLVMKLIDASRAQKLHSEKIKECPFCFNDIPFRASKCPKCTGDIPKA
jgi:large conductance mechanosensitive channel